MNVLKKKKVNHGFITRIIVRRIPARGQDDFVGFELSLFAHQRHVHESFVLQQYFDGVHHVDQMIVPPETILRRVHVR